MADVLFSRIDVGQNGVAVNVRWGFSGVRFLKGRLCGADTFTFRTVICHMIWNVRKRIGGNVGFIFP
jgi:hypothetical protein